MFDRTRRRRLRRELEAAVKEKRAREMQDAACPMCGRKPLSIVRFIFEDEKLCPGCDALIEQHGIPGRVYAIKDVVPLDPDAPDESDDDETRSA
jgi:hypothetical protein